MVGRTKKVKNNSRNIRKFPEKCDDDTCRDLLGETEECKVGLGKELGLVRRDRTGKYETSGSIGSLVLCACLQQLGGPICFLATDIRK